MHTHTHTYTHTAPLPRKYPLHTHIHIQTHTLAHIHTHLRQAVRERCNEIVQTLLLLLVGLLQLAVGFGVQVEFRLLLGEGRGGLVEGLGVLRNK